MFGGVNCPPYHNDYTPAGTALCQPSFTATFKSYACSRLTKTEKRR